MKVTVDGEYVVMSIEFEPGEELKQLTLNVGKKPEKKDPAEEK